MRYLTGARSFFFSRLASSTRACSVSSIVPGLRTLRVTAWTFLPKSRSEPVLGKFTRSRTVPFLRLWLMPAIAKLALQTGETPTGCMTAETPLPLQ